TASGRGGRGAAGPGVDGAGRAGGAGGGPGLRVGGEDQADVVPRARRLSGPPRRGRPRLPGRGGRPERGELDDAEAAGERVHRRGGDRQRRRRRCGRRGARLVEELLGARRGGVLRQPPLGHRGRAARGETGGGGRLEVRHRQGRVPRRPPPGDGAAALGGGDTAAAAAAGAGGNAADDGVDAAADPAGVVRVVVGENPGRARTRGGGLVGR